MSVQEQVQNDEKSWFGWKTRAWMFVICFLVVVEVWTSLSYQYYRNKTTHYEFFLPIVFMLVSFILAYRLIQKGTNPFWALVRNEMKSLFEWKKSTWVIIICVFGITYFLGILIFGFNPRFSHLSVASYSTFASTYQVLPLLAYLLIPFGFAYHSVRKEWKESTVGWWSTLPYSREQLISSKIIAIVMRLLQVYLPTSLLTLIVGTMGLSYLENIPLTDLYPASGGGFLGFWIFTSGLISLVLGIVTALLRESTLKQYGRWLLVGLPILLIVWYVAKTFLIAFIAHSISYSISPRLIYYYPSYAVWMSMGYTISDWLIAYLLYRYAVYLYKAKVEV